jgi:predicted amidohydrolase
MGDTTLAATGLRLALAQMRCEKGDIAGNLESMRRAVEDAGTYGTDILVFPEMSITGYIDPTRMPDAVLRANGPEVAQFAALTRGTRLTALAGLVEENPAGKPFITQIVAQHGSLAGLYRKQTIKGDEEPWFAPGPPELALFRHAIIPFGVAVCADSGNRPIFEEYARRGAQLILVASAPGLYGEQATRNWQSSFHWWRQACRDELGSSAHDYGIWIAVATQAGRTVDEDFPGGGYVFNPQGDCVAATPDWSEGVLYATIR